MLPVHQSPKFAAYSAFVREKFVYPWGIWAISLWIILQLDSPPNLPSPKNLCQQNPELTCLALQGPPPVPCASLTEWSLLPLGLNKPDEVWKRTSPAFVAHNAEDQLGLHTVPTHSCDLILLFYSLHSWAALFEKTTKSSQWLWKSAVKNRIHSFSQKMRQD